MPKSLCNRLEDLENEIHVLLSLQEGGSGACQILKGKTVTKHPDGNIEHIEFEGSTCPGAQSIAKQCMCPPVCYSPPKSPERRVQCLCIKQEGDGDDDDECWELLSKLQNEKCNLEEQLKQAQRCKQQAVGEAQQLKKGIDKLSQGSDELSTLKLEKEQLFEKLEGETSTKRRLSLQAEAAAKRNAKKIKAKLCQVTYISAKTCIKQRNHNAQLACVVRKREDHLKKCMYTTEQLLACIAERDIEIRRLQDELNEVLKNLAEAELANKALAEQNAALIKSVRELQDKICCEKSCIQNLIKYIQQTKCETCRLNEEMDRLRCRLRCVLDGPKQIGKYAKLEERLRESREREQLWLDEAAVMKAKLDEVEKSQEKTEINYEEEADRLCRKNKRLQEKFDEAVAENERIKADIERRLAELREEYERKLEELRKRYQNLIRQRDKALRDLEMALKCADRDKKLAEQILVKYKELEAIMYEQQAIMAEQDEQIAALEKELAALQARFAELEEEILALKALIEQQQSEIEGLKAKIADILAAIEREREEGATKDKLIADLLRQIEELNNLINELQEQLKRTLEETAEAKQALEDAVNELGALNDRLKAEDSRTSRDEGTGGRSPEEEAKLALIPFLLRKLELMERKRELQLELVLKQKQRAVVAAKFSSQKLLETVMDFRNQKCVYKKMHYVLLCLLLDQEDLIREMQETCEPCGMPTGRLKPMLVGCCSTKCADKC